jgi:predicted  nucleic acid-binding Zn-ribbon protein
MAATVEEADNTLSDDIVDLQKQIQNMKHNQAEDNCRIRQLQTEMKDLVAKLKEMENLAVTNAKLQDTRMNNFADTLAAL